MSLEAGSNGFASVSQAPAVKRLRVLTVNTHKGFTAFNRRFILPELREAVRSTQADIVFLQEVLGSHDRHAARYPGWPQTSQYEFLADSMWSDFAYGRNAVYPDGHHGNALLSKYPIIEHRNLDVSITGPERRGLLHCVLEVPGQGQVHAVCVHLSLLESHRQKQLQLLRKLLDALPANAPVIIMRRLQRLEKPWQPHPWPATRLARSLRAPPRPPRAHLPGPPAAATPGPHIPA